MNVCALAALAASSTSCWLAPGRPKEMLARMVVAKRTGSWLTRPTWLRSQDSGTSLISMPSSTYEKSGFDVANRLEL